MLALCAPMAAGDRSQRLWTRSVKSRAAATVARCPFPRLRSAPRRSTPHAASADPSRGLVSRVTICKMELSESVQRGLQSLAEPSSFDRSSFEALLDASFRSLLSSHADPGVLGELPPLPAAAAFVSAAVSGSFLPRTDEELYLDVRGFSRCRSGRIPIPWVRVRGPERGEARQPR